ncbi:MAG TPA: ribosome assembly factor SBDS [Candidatus Nanoarchaeia archaeon]|nr:ribosome assembly factor SBDS [Candidatus Nanoarchaeia archaeon]
MVDVDKAIVAKLKLKGINFEILVDCDKALEYRAGRLKDLDNVLATQDIFNDVKKGLHASFLRDTFGTDDKRKIAERIIKEGEIQLTTQHKNKLREELRKRIIQTIHRNAINPKTNIPHPPARIESALEEAKVKIDEYKSAEEQVVEIVKKINGILPIKYETREVLLKIPAKFSGQSYTIAKQYGKLLKEDWQNNGNLYLTVEIPAGLQNELLDKMNGLTKGSVELSVIGKR